MPDLQVIESTVMSALAQDAVELVDLRFLQEGGRWILRFFVDKHGGISLDDCERISERIGSVLDAADVMTHPYVLEVSSPGVDRILKKEKDFARFAGHRIKVALKRPLDGRRRFSGFLKGSADGRLLLESGGSELSLPLESVDEARLDPELEI